MSWKGFSKAVARLPQRVMSKTGHAETTQDPEFDDLEARFRELENFTQKLNENAKRYKTALDSMFKHQESFAQTLMAVLQPITSGSLKNGEADSEWGIASAESLKAIEALQARSVEMKERIMPDLEEVINRQVVQPTNDLMQLHKMVGKTVIKREHKMVDYDRHRDNLNKAQNKPNRTAEDDRKLIKLQTLNDVAEQEFSRWNELLKQQLPIYVDSRVMFIDPVFRALMNFQLRMFSQMLSIYQELGRQFDLSGPILSTFEAKIAEPREAILSLPILKDPLGIERSVRPDGFVSPGTSPTKGSPALAPAAPITGPSIYKNHQAMAAAGTSAASHASNDDWGTVGDAAADIPPPAYQTVHRPSASGSAGPARAPIARKPSAAAVGPGMIPDHVYGSAATAMVENAGYTAPPPSIMNPLAAAAAARALQNNAGPSQAPKPLTAKPTISSAKPTMAPKPTLTPAFKPTYWCVALYDYTAQAPGDLSFSKDDRIEILQKTESTNDWWQGRVNGQTGQFPGTFTIFGSYNGMEG